MQIAGPPVDREPVLVIVGHESVSGAAADPFGALGQVSRIGFFHQLEMLATVESSGAVAVGPSRATCVTEYDPIARNPDQAVSVRKPPSTVLGRGGHLRPQVGRRIGHEDRRRNVVGLQADVLRKSTAVDQVHGHRSGNDASHRDGERKDGQWISR